MLATDAFARGILMMRDGPLGMCTGNVQEMNVGKNKTFQNAVFLRIAPNTEDA